jgi:hypothetical protein
MVPTTVIHAQILFMQVPVVQIRIMRMLMYELIMSVMVRMPFAIQYCFSLVQMVVMPISMLVVMNVFHYPMSVKMFMR